MNKRINKLFSCCLDNRVVVIDTNFKHFCDHFKKVEPDSRSCRWFFNRFKDESEFEYSVNGKIYFFQKLI